jgi:hypothetical protein
MMSENPPAAVGRPPAMSDEGDHLAPYRDAPFYRDYLQPLLIAGMVTALFTGPIVFLRQMAPPELSRYLLAIVFLISLEGVFTTRWLARPEQRQVSRLAYRAAEFGVIAVLLRLFTWTSAGSLPTPAELRDFLLAPILFLDSHFFLHLHLALFTLERSSNLAGLFTGLDLSNDEVAFYSLPPHRRELIQHEKPPLTDRSHLLDSFFKQWVLGGVLLGLFAVLTSFDLNLATDWRAISHLGLPPAMLLALLVYFILGLWLTSHARLAVVRARWLVYAVQTHTNVGLMWRRYSLWLLLLVALIAAFLPIGSTIAIARILEALVIAGVLIFQAIVSVLLLLFYLLLARFIGQGEPEEVPSVEAPPPPAPLPLPEGGVTGEGGALVIGALFWVVVVVVTAVAILFFLRERGYPVNLAPLTRFWQSLTSWLQQLWVDLGRGLAGIHQAARARLGALRKKGGEGKAPWRFIRPGALPPQEQVRFFYLSAVRRAARQGVKRRKNETPLEYARSLESNWPEAEQDIEELTGAFVKARYSAQEIVPDEATLVKRVWQRVQTVLRRKK